MIYQYLTYHATGFQVTDSVRLYKKGSRNG